MIRLSSLWRLAVASVGLLALVAAVSAQTPEVYIRVVEPSPTPHLVEVQLSDTSPAPRGKLPVLFVHGHNLLSPTDNTRNYRNNWQERVGDLPSFMETLDLVNNAELGIEDYYIRFQTQGRSIADDAAEIGAAVELILHRHDTKYPVDRQTTNVQVVIIAYSKGTISTRLYLKSLREQVVGFPSPRPGFRPISEFIAIAPPNHGLNTDLGGTTCAGQQLKNGMAPDCASLSLDPNCSPSPLGFFSFLNGHPLPIDDTTLRLDDIGPFETEAPDSRPPILDGRPNPPTNGTLYVTLFANSTDLNPDGRDFVGGDRQPTTDCRGRRLAKNLSANAVNIAVPEISNASFIPFVPGSETFVHRNTVHTFEVICKALYAAVHHRSPEGQSCANVVVNSASLPIIPPPTRAAAMLTLDFSGSMSTPAPPHPSRAAALTQAVQLFIELWKAVSVPSDRLGVTYFRSIVEQKQFGPANETLPLLSAHGDDVKDDVRNQSPDDSTAMGGALQQAIEALKGFPDAPIRRVILFTDGMQNLNPMVQTTVDAQGMSQLVINDEPGRQSSGVSPTNPPTVLNRSIGLTVTPGVPPTAPGIAIDTIGIGAGTAFVGLLRDIADQTGGRSWPTSDPAVDLRRFFIEQLINALKGFSPQLVAYRRGAIAPGGSTEAFAIEDGVRKLVLKVSWKPGDSIDFSVAKDGVDVTSAGRFVNGEFYKIFVIDLPAKSGPTARGNWQVRIKGQATTPYEAAAIIDGGSISYDAMFVAKRPRVGVPLDLVVRLTADGKPIRRSPKVTVTLTSPRLAVGDIIATIHPKELKAFEPGITSAEAQMLSLTQDPKRWAALKPRRKTIVLKATDKGDFRTQFLPKIPGIYTAFVTIEGEDARIGQFSRTLTVTEVVQFTAAKLKDRDVSVGQTAAGGGWRYVSLVLSPRDAYGHRMGPGLSSAISLKLSAGRRVGGTHDLGDGRYMLVVAVAPGDDPKITLEVNGGALFTGRLSQLSGK